jgi:hypothetical protein
MKYRCESAVTNISKAFPPGPNGVTDGIIVQRGMTNIFSAVEKQQLVNRKIHYLP